MNCQYNNSTRQIIITCQPDAAAYALAEIRALDNAARRSKWLQEDAQLIDIPGGYRQLLENIRHTPPVYTRHIFPVTHSCPAAGFTTAALQPLAEQFPASVSYSLQIRHTATATDVADIKSAFWQMSDRLQSGSCVYNARQPAIILSVFIDTDTIYYGLSAASDNLSDWNGGIHRFRREENLISRAEFKLLEAISSFGIEFPDGCKNALDLGAAPGGWTKVLLQHGMNVTAIDPAEMHESLRKNKLVRHFRGASQTFRYKPGAYQLLVNDMRMDALKSAAIMLDMKSCLADGGIAVMTLKLPGNDWHNTVQQSLRLLERGYTILRARQLFNNRSEVTVYMKKTP